MMYRKSPPAKPSLDGAPKVELKALPRYVRHVFLGKDDTFLVFIASDFNVHQVESLVEVLKRFKRDIGLTITDII